MIEMESLALIDHFDVTGTRSLGWDQLLVIAKGISKGGTGGDQCNPILWSFGTCD